MAIKPSPTIAGKLRKLFSNNKQTIEPAIGGSIPGGGANVLTLYAGMKDGTTPWAYKNQERTEEYESYEEALDAVRSADVIKLDNSVPESDNIIFAGSWSAAPIDGSVTVSASGDVTIVYNLYGSRGGK